MATDSSQTATRCYGVIVLITANRKRRRCVGVWMPWLGVVGVIGLVSNRATWPYCLACSLRHLDNGSKRLDEGGGIDGGKGGGDYLLINAMSHCLLRAGVRPVPSLSHLAQCVCVFARLIEFPGAPRILSRREAHKQQAKAIRDRVV